MYRLQAAFWYRGDTNMKITSFKVTSFLDVISTIGGFLSIVKLTFGMLLSILLIKRMWREEAVNILKQRDENIENEENLKII